jgi:hypothetical protein
VRYGQPARPSRAYPFDPICQEPVKALDEQKEAKHDPELDVEVVSEDGEGKERFGDEEPCSIIQTLRRQ